jgi:hypothetical protein
MGVWTWLGPSLLFAASLAATAVSYFGIRKSNQTNRDAIGAADERAIADRAEMRDRDFRTWQRDALLRLAEGASQPPSKLTTFISRLRTHPSLSRTQWSRLLREEEQLVRRRRLSE